SQDEEDKLFKRNVWVEGSNFWDRAIRKKRADSMDRKPAATPPVTTILDPAQYRRPSIGVEKNRRNSEFAASSSATKPVASKGISYVFLSPWDGRCEFYTGSG